MTAFIENYYGSWKDTSGNRFEISRVNDNETKVTFYRAGEDNPMIRPWFNNKPSVDMVATLDFETQADLDIQLGGSENGFVFSLSLDFLDDSSRTATSSIIRYEKSSYLDQYYYLFGPLGHYTKS